MTADEYAADCAAQQCDPCVVTMAKLQERDAIVAYLRRMSSRRLATETESWLLCSFANCIEAEDHHL